MYSEIREALYRLEIANITNRSANDFIAGLRKDVDRLMPEDLWKFMQGKVV